MMRARVEVVMYAGVDGFSRLLIAVGLVALLAGESGAPLGPRHLPPPSQAISRQSLDAQIDAADVICIGTAGEPTETSVGTLDNGATIHGEWSKVPFAVTDVLKGKPDDQITLQVFASTETYWVGGPLVSIQPRQRCALFLKAVPGKSATYAVLTPGGPILLLGEVRAFKDTDTTLVDKLISEMLQASQSNDINISIPAITWLGYVGGREGIVPLLTGLSDSKNARLRNACLLARLRLKDATAIDAIGDLSGERDAPIGEIGYALGKFTDTKFLSAMVKLSSHKEVSVRQGASWALREMKDARTVPTLIGLLEDSDVHVQFNAVVGLAYRTGKLKWAPTYSYFAADKETTIGKWKDWWSKEEKSQFDKPGPTTSEATHVNPVEVGHTGPIVMPLREK